MNGRLKYEVANWVPKAVLALSLCAPGLATGTAHAQRPVKTSLRVMVPQPVAVPRVIRGQTVESVVINRVVLVFGELAVTEEPAVADTPVEQPPKPKQRVILFSGTFDELVYGSGSNASDVRARLEDRLKQKLDKIDRISGLTDAQRQKLQLAGRGDLKRLFDRAEKLRAKCDSYADVPDLNQFQRWTEDLKSESNALSHSFNAGPFDAGSLMAKCMKASLTAVQAARYATFEATPPYQPPQRGPTRLEGAIELK